MNMKATFGEKIFYVLNYVMLAIAGLACFLPLVHIAAISLSDSGSIMTGKVIFWPVGWTGLSYYYLFVGTNIINAFGNSIIIMLVGVVLSMLGTITVAYPLSKSYFYGQQFFSKAIVFTMLFSGGLIPSYLLIKSLGLTNTYWALWLPGLVSTYNMLIMRTFFQSIPRELEEAARIDGCGEINLLIRIIIPTSLPMLVTIALFYGVGYWNNFFNVLIYITDTSKLNLAVLVQQMIFSATDPTQLLDPDLQQLITPDGMKAAGILVMVIPMVLVYPFLQKYFIKGVMIGSLKG